MKGSIVLVGLVLVLIGVGEVEMLPEAMKQLTTGFLKVIEQCKSELSLTDSVLGDLYHLWKEEYDQVSRDCGCLISCMSKKLDLLDVDGRIHHGNTKDYVINNGGGEDVASQLITIAHDCEKQYESVDDDCDRMLGMIKCFRASIKQVQWTPKMEVVITEFIAEA